MSIIYSFLQKRKLHESQYGYIMVLAAYILSALMLLLGSDLFYNINTEAAGIETDTEETSGTLNTQQYGLDYDTYTTQITSSGIINPYGLADTETENTNIKSVEIKDSKTTGKVENETADTISTSGDTVWLFGDAMDGETFDSLVQKLGSIKPAKQRDKTSTKNQSVENTLSAKYGNISNKDISMLERIVQAEAGGEDMKGKILVANVIMNRVTSKKFPDTIKGVIFQKRNHGYQFSPVGSGSYWSARVSAQTKQAVKRALNGEDYSKGALYFVARKRTSSHSMEWFDEKLDWLFKHGGHEFYKNK